MWAKRAPYGEKPSDVRVHACTCVRAHACVQVCVEREKSGSRWPTHLQWAFGSGLLAGAPPDPGVRSLNGRPGRPASVCAGKGQCQTVRGTGIIEGVTSS